ncbi:hypothetical protein CJD36_013070 [Flavipsychrobacter stenotrophus]|uniref:Lipoprotein n=1 Tax=Flavipsychrobacter stenotrophus TaxID=2077091 RepID=A0A2S7SWJ3_9BACT|nr:hypothetical protein [Flavipsychrobacter stenotrophus]PQJ10896.1 hypothetical protein CJD36_013070 [Flavipsychrobacter stenotrophus]
MKRIVAVLVVISLLAFVACKKKKHYPVTNSVQQNNNQDTAVGMNATINGHAWTTDSAYAYRIRYANDSVMSDLYINATRKVNDTTSTISFSIVNYTGPKNYLIDPPNVSATYYINGERHYATLGEINIESDSPYAMIGTFNFTVDSTVVTDGSFNVAKP